MLFRSKDPAMRPSAEELLASSFFRSGKRKGYLVGTVLRDLPPLVQRQERRRIPSVLAHATMASWDFAATEIGSVGGGGGGGGGVRGRLASPTTSVYSHHSSAGGHHPAGTNASNTGAAAAGPVASAVRKRSVVIVDGVFEIDDEGEGGKDGNGDRNDDGGRKEEGEEGAAAYARRIRTQRRSTASLSRSRTHSRSVSWAESADDSTDADAEASSVPARIEEGVASVGLNIDGSPPPSTPPRVQDLPSPPRPPDADPKITRTPHLSPASMVPLPISSSPSASASSESRTSMSTDRSDVELTLSSSPAAAGRLWRKFVRRGSHTDKKTTNGVGSERGGEREKEKERDSRDRVVSGESIRRRMSKLTGRIHA